MEFAFYVSFLSQVWKLSQHVDCSYSRQNK